MYRYADRHKMTRGSTFKKQYTFMRYIHCMPRPRVEYTRVRDHRDIEEGKETTERKERTRYTCGKSREIVEFVGLVYMCEVRGQNRTKKKEKKKKKKTNEKHRGHKSGMSCPYGYKYLMGINMSRPYGIYGRFPE